MKALTVYMPDRYGKYERMLNVLRETWKEHSNIPLQEETATLPSHSDPEKSSPNVRKLQIWLENFDQDTIFLDCDMMVMGNPEEAFSMIDNIAFAERSGSSLPLNGGVVFAKKTEYTQRLLEEWMRVNWEMRRNRNFQKIWQSKYGGTNQAAMGYMLENGWEIEKVPEIYNVSNSWERFHNPKLVHIKSRLRKDVLESRIPKSKFARIWRQYEGTLDIDPPKPRRRRRNK